ncbi:multi-sensor hybrid histidine kinase [Aminomonas paucivorans DSM 12260]|uniref:histidine kinase n=1 Tax=Aminomonas paucivorans DSM 12260 TaxID=584708 RepID=E3CV56_9BACT|nr:PAS domain-containing sensor histidine kinase [Aminomonas paucivorans]EFQ24143.1 multi-sensor hybrid histidine kinase [Aminomonas paucivorans DSM 12260]
MERRRIGGIPLKWIAGGLGVLLLLSGFLLIRDGLEILRFQEQRLLLASRQVLEVLAAQRMALLGFRKDQLLADGRVMARSPVVEMAVLPLLGGKPSPDSLHFLTRWLELRRRVFHHRGAVLLDAAGHPRLEVGGGVFPADRVAQVLARLRGGAEPRLVDLGGTPEESTVVLGIPLMREGMEAAPGGFVLYLLDPRQFLRGVLDPLPLPYAGGRVRLRFPLSPEERGTREEDRLVARADLPGFAWLVEVSVPRDEVLRPLREKVRLLLGAAGFLVLALALGGLAMWNRRETQFYRHRYELERDLRASEERYRRIVETSLEGICALDEGFRVILANPRLCEMLGYEKEEELLGRPVEEFLFPEDREDQRLRHEVRRSGRGERYERRFRRRDGENLWAHVSASPVQDEEGRFCGSFAMLTDQTARVEADRLRARLEDQLLQAQKMESVGRLAGGVAHDFNNLLTGILGYTELARGKLEGQEGAVRDLEEVERLGRRATDLTRQLLAFSRRQTLDPKVVDLNERIEESLRLLDRLLGEDVQIRFRPGEDLGLVRVDPAQFEQVLVNLAVNARDAMPEGGILSLRTSHVELRAEAAVWYLEAAPGSYVLLEVSDTGTGMDEETRAHLFEPFFTTKPVGKGTGLGLSMVYGIVKQHGGHLWVYSEPGKGSTFKIYLPREGGSLEPSGEPQKDPRQETPLEGLVLLAEDEPAVRGLVERILRGRGLEVLVAENARQAEALFRERKDQVQLLLSDVVLPDLNGKELHERLLAIRPDLPVLFTSGYHEDVIAHRGVLDPGVLFLPKPFTARDLVAKVREALGRDGA